MSAPVEAYTPINGSAGNSASVSGVTGGRRHRKLKLVTRKQARTMLKKLGKKMRGGAPTDPVVVPADTTKEEGAMGGRRRRHGTKKTHRKSRRSLFGLKY